MEMEIWMYSSIYGIPTRSNLFLNEKGSFTLLQDVFLDTLGMITDAEMVDLDQDGKLELLVAREWGAPLALELVNGKLQSKFSSPIAPRGWWTAIRVEDVNKDGLPDILLGNHGTNSRFRASEDKPITMHVGDFDFNGRPEQIISRFLGDTSYPMALRHDLVAQMPWLKKKYLKYDSYYGQQVDDIFSPDQLERSLVYRVTELRSGALINRGESFDFVPFPAIAQTSVITCFEPLADASEAFPIYIAGGNLRAVKPEVGSYDGMSGVLIQWNGEGFSARRSQRQGLNLPGDIRDFASLKSGPNKLLLVARNNAPPLLFQINADVLQ